MRALMEPAVRVPLAAILLAVSLALATSTPDDRAASVGSWHVVAVEMNGKQVDPTITAMLLVDYREDGSWTVLFKGMPVGEGTSHNNPEASPRTFEMKTLGGAKTPPRTYSGIYRLEGDTRQLCFVGAGLPRPDGFAAPRGSGRILVTLERAGARGAR
ncbi:MAG: TIGR03067 domain-containing protein [Planctomycetia bacterium]